MRAVHIDRKALREAPPLLQYNPIAFGLKIFSRNNDLRVHGHGLVPCATLRKAFWFARMRGLFVGWHPF